MTEVAKLLESVKVDLRSVVISVQGGLSVRQLQVDYAEMLGQKIPFTQLGYNDIFDFLRSIPDVVRLQWSNARNDYWVSAVSVEETKHIEQMVRKQKTNKKKKPKFVNMTHEGYGHRNTISSSKNWYNPPRLEKNSCTLPSSLERSVRMLVAKYPRGLSLSEFEWAYYGMYGKAFNCTSYGFTSLEKCLQTLRGIKLKMEPHGPKVYRIDSSPEHLGNTLNHDSSVQSYLPVNDSKTALLNNSSCETRSFTEKVIPVNRKMDSLDDFSTTLDNTTSHVNRSSPLTYRTLQANFFSQGDTLVNKKMDSLDDFSTTLDNNTSQVNRSSHLTYRTLQANSSSQGDTTSSADGHSQPESSRSNTASPACTTPQTFTTNETNIAPQASVASQAITFQEHLPSRTTTDLQADNISLSRVSSHATRVSPALQADVMSWINDVSLSNRSSHADSAVFPSSTSQDNYTFSNSASRTDTVSPSRTTLQPLATPHAYANCMKQDLSVKSTSFVDTPALKTFDKSLAFEMCSNDLVSEHMKDEFRLIMEKYPKGIWASHFSDLYERLTGKELDLKSIGFYSLLELFNGCPDIFVTERPQGSSGDWLVRDARRWRAQHEIRKTYICAGQPTDLDNLDFSEDAKFNVLKLLQGHPDGLLVEELNAIYERNCGEPLPWLQHGFLNVREFVVALAKILPIKMEGIKGSLYIKLKNENNNALRKSAALPHHQNEVMRPSMKMPPDVVNPERKYAYQSLPPDLDSDKYIAIYVSNVDTPSQLWIQLKEEVVKLDELMDAMEDHYYNREISDLYKMPESSIMIGNICVALWPVDNNWHRVLITAIPSMDMVEVLYVDYGTKSQVNKATLRLLREQYVCLPAQAIKARIDCIKPPRNETTWNKRTNDRLLELCNDRPLMAQISQREEIPSVHLCDVSGDEDLHITDQLVCEGLAEYERSATEPQPVPTPDFSSLLSTLQAAAAQLPTSPPSAQENNPLYQVLLLVQAILQQCQASNSNSSLFNNTPQTSDLLSLLPLLQNTVALQRQSNNLPTHPSTATPQTPDVLSLLSLLQNSATMQKQSNNLPTPPTSTGSGTSSGRCTGDAYSDSADLISFRSGNEASTKPSSGKQVGVAAALPRTRDLIKLEEKCEPAIVLSDDEVIGEEEDELIRQLCDDMDRLQRKKRRVKKLCLKDSYNVHIINYDDMPFMTDHDISSLFWTHNDSHLLSRRLTTKKLDLSPVIINRERNENLFNQMFRFKVKGIKESTKVVTLYSLSSVIKILDNFGHPSLTIIDELEEEINIFDPECEFWRHLHDESDDDESDRLAINSNGDISRLCRDDLEFCYQRLLATRYTTINEMSQIRSPEKLDSDKLNQCVEKLKSIDIQCQKVSKRMQELQSRKGLLEQQLRAPSRRISRDKESEASGV